MADKGTPPPVIPMEDFFNQTRNRSASDLPGRQPQQLPGALKDRMNIFVKS